MVETFSNILISIFAISSSRPLVVQDACMIRSCFVLDGAQYYNTDIRVLDRFSFHCSSLLAKTTLLFLIVACILAQTYLMVAAVSLV